MAAVSDTAGIVLDCSAALALFLDDEQPALALAVLDALPDRDFWIPILWHSEFANALLMAQRRRRLTPARAQQILAQSARLPLQLDMDTPAPARLFELASMHELTAYDATYFELAQRRGLALATLDKALAASAGGAGIALFDGRTRARSVNEGRPPYRKRQRP